MKCKVIFGMLAAALIAATSCESNLETSADGTSTVTLNVGAPVIATRAYSDGTTATELQYAVYSVGKNDVLTKLDLDGRKTFSLSTNVDLQLTTGQTYAVVFWAASPEAPYSVAFNKDGAEMTVDYAEAVCNDENRDAFYKYEKFTVTGTMALDVKLTRPFAQLNIGTNDFEASAAAGYTVTQSSVTVPVYTSLDLVSGDVETAAEQTFALADLPEGETFPVKGYEYLSMNYLLVPADKEVVDVTFSYTDGNVEKTRVVGSVPVQRNYRTNIYGQLLTSNVDINVEVEPDYETPDHPSEFEEALAIAAQVGGTVTLTEDQTLTEPVVISGLKTKAAVGVTMTIDLNGHTISYTSDVAATSAMLTVNSGNKLVVKDSQGTGKISYEYTGAGDPNFGWGSYTIANNGTLVVESGKIEMVCKLNNAQEVTHMYCAIHQGGGSTVVNGGTVACETYRSIRVNRGTLVINGGEFVGQVWMQPSSEGTSLTINGGEFAPAGPDMSSVYVENSNYVVALDVKGGTFATKIGCASPAKEGTKGSVSGGTFTDATGMNEDLIVEGFKLLDGKIVADEVDAVVEDAAGITEAIQNGGSTVLLSEGTYVIPSAAKGKADLTFVGTGNPEDVEVAVTKVGTGGENCDYGLDGSTVTFDGITITTNSSTYIGYARCNGTYKNCIINGTFTLYGDSVFENCTFNVSGDVYNLWTWGAPTAKFINCTFNSDGKALLLYGTANTKLTVENCTFNDKGGLSDLKAAIEIGNDYGKSYELVVNKTTVNGYEINDKGINTGTTLWANKSSMPQSNLNVVVDGVDVY